MIPFLRKSVFIFRFLFRYIGIILFIGIVSIFSIRLALPFLASLEMFSNFSLLETAKENTTVINNREEIIIRDDDRLDRSIQNVSNSIVYIMMQEKALTKRIFSLTGTILTTDGLLVTSFSDSLDFSETTYDIMDFDGTRFDAKFFAYDSFSHLLYLRISGDNFTPVVFADSEDFSSGRKVIALGENDILNQNEIYFGVIKTFNPTFSLANKVSSSTEKHQGVFEVSFLEEKDIRSGSPVLSYTGELMGILGTRTVGDQSFPYVLRGNDMKKSMQRVVANPSYQPPFFGASYISITPTIAKRNDLNIESGAWLSFEQKTSPLSPVVLLGSPAQKAGFRYGDIIRSVNDISISYENPLSNVLSNFKEKDEVTVSFVRQGIEQKVTVVLGAQPE
ncbi:MAG: serine protease [Candidatus Moraniibacteriota bacterium]|nr:MAG: serine protease [Candidatus Moranbacteria bacterium]